MAFQLTPLHIPSLTTNYGAENAAVSSMSQTLGNLIPDMRKQQQEQRKLDLQEQRLGALGQAAKTGDFNSLGRALIGTGDIQGGAALLSLGQKEADRKLEQDWIRGSAASPTAAVAPIGTPNEVENRFLGGVQNAGLTNPNGLAAVAAYGRSESGYSPQNAGRTWNDPSESGQPGQAGGIMSWRAERLQNLQRFAASRGEQGNGSPETQAAFLASEDPTLIPRLNAAQTPQEANQIMAQAWRFGGYDRPGQGEHARREGLTAQYAQRYGNQPTSQRPVQVAETEEDVQRLEQAQATRADAPAAGAANAQGFAIPGTGEIIPQAISTDPAVRMAMGRYVTAPTERTRAAAKAQLDLAVKDAERRVEGSKPTDVQRNYELARRQGYQGSFVDYQKELRAAGKTEINLGAGEKEYDKQSAKDFAELSRDVAKRGANANGKIATLNRLETLLANPNVRTGAGAQAALTLARAAKALFGIETEGLGPAEAVNAIANGFALELRNPSGGAGMPGALSDKDREFLMSLTPGLERTPEGNKLIIDYMRRLAKRDIEIEGLRRDYIKQNKRLDDGFYERLAEFSEKNPLFPEAETAEPKAAGRGQPAPAAAAPALPQGYADQYRRPDGSSPPLPSPAAQPPMQGARQASDGNWYVPDSERPGKYLQVR
ncbi:phage tail tip lysozyme [Bosea sp. (in: a-proteobacteria)]|uniref:phage tail tip lysozyme n=1 Tax=Bosea sp. (in: a-proteobacteria) TaxID=1871050 RepID=UPI0026075122|nr:phage tail tip lysozyme [Bosea sp. (in: a-proteobacteria)]MCO5092663.1 hypothetical protein [Bosea sp. (in: a-proteobacteria)]